MGLMGGVRLGQVDRGGEENGVVA